METVVTRALERRAAPRHRPDPGSNTANVRVRPGRQATLIDVSAIGVLIETTYRLLPGSVVDMQLPETDTRTSTRARIVRCFVSGLHGGCIWYRVGLRFEGPLLGPGSVVRNGYAIPANEWHRRGEARGHGSPVLG